MTFPTLVLFNLMALSVVGADSDTEISKRLSALQIRKEQARDAKSFHLAESNSVILSRKNTTRQPYAGTLGRALASSDFEIGEDLGSATKVKLKFSTSKLTTRITNSNNPCRKLRRSLIKASLKNNSLAPLAFKMNDCDPNYIVSADATLPNEFNFMTSTQKQHLQGPTAIRVTDAWNFTQGNNVIVGVIDTGIQYNHPDLAANVWNNPGEIAGNGIDDDGNGYIDDRYGINAITNSGNPWDDNGHGTHVAGTIGAVGNNGIGTTGVAWNVKLISCKFLSSSGSGSTSDALKCINYFKTLQQRGTKLILSNNSWGGGGYAQSIWNAIDSLRPMGQQFIAAAGNNNNNNDTNPSYPCSYNNVNIICVAAFDSSTGQRASFSNYGTTNVDIAAPGVNIYSTYINSSYANLSGTSMATPIVSGSFALMVAAAPSQNRNVIRVRMLAGSLSAANLNGVTGGNTPGVGRRLNVSEGVRRAMLP